MWRRHAHDWPVPKVQARRWSLPFLVALLGVLMMPASRAQEAAPAGSGGTDAGPIDTSITVQPSRATKPIQDISGAKAKSGLAAQPRQQAARPQGDRTTPNAIGFPVAKGPAPPQAGLPRVPPPIPGPATAPANRIAPGNAGLVGAGTKFDRSAATNHAAISGTGMTHVGTGLGMIQGTPKRSGTISGTKR